MDLRSADVPTGVNGQHQEYNKLREDLIGHTHDGNTERIDHENLTSGGKLVDTDYGHDEIDEHIESGQAHCGLNEGYVALVQGKQFIVDRGQVEIAWDKSGVYEVFNCTSWNNTVDITFNVEFAEDCEPLVFPQMTKIAGQGNELALAMHVKEITNTGCTVMFFNEWFVSPEYCSHRTTTYNGPITSDDTVRLSLDWVAIGWLEDASS